MSIIGSNITYKYNPLAQRFDIISAVGGTGSLGSGTSFLLQSEDGTWWRITVDNSGSLISTAVPAP